MTFISRKMRGGPSLLPGDDSATAMSVIRAVLVTVPDRNTAIRLVRLLVDEGLVACGNILPEITSIYRWKGEVQQAGEVLLILKTEASRVPALLLRIPQEHPYEVPEILVLDVVAGHPPYLEWVREETLEDGSKEP